LGRRVIVTPGLAGPSQKPEGIDKGVVLRKFASFTFVSAIILSATFAHAQQFDFAAGAGILFSAKNSNASINFPPPAEKGGIYPSVTIDRIFSNHFGYSAEVSTVYKRQLYNDFQQYRPFFYDVNGAFAPHLANRTSGLFTAGFGGETLLFYNPDGQCFFSSGCTTHLNSNHFLVHAGAGISYRFLRQFFVRPEANLYHIFNNNQFHSDNVLRLGASVGYTFHRD
jgi:hypothetical protein